METPMHIKCSELRELSGDVQQDGCLYKPTSAV